MNGLSIINIYLEIGVILINGNSVRSSLYTLLYGGRRRCRTPDTRSYYRIKFFSYEFILISQFYDQKKKKQNAKANWSNKYHELKSWPSFNFIFLEFSYLLCSCDLYSYQGKSCQREEKKIQNMYCDEWMWSFIRNSPFKNS